MLKIQSDRIIIDGHEPTKEQCETMTLLANALAESDKFKTVEYESGYAEFEKVVKADELKFVPAPPQDATVIFDSHIISVNCPDSGGNWATSGTTVNGNYDEYLTYDVTLEDGYVIDTVVVSGTTPPESPVISNDGKSFYGILTSGDSFTVTITSKSTVSRKSIDLTTLPGWSSLSSGSHSITIVAKADGYRDSEPSAAVQVEKAAAMPNKGDIITLDSKQYRVLKTEGTVAEVLAMYDSTTSQKFGSSQTYANSDLDTYCNTTFFNSLSSAMQTAIVEKTFRQDSWYRKNKGNPIYQGREGSNYNYSLGLGNATFGSSISRKCYVLTVQDIIGYLGVTTAMTSANTTLTSENIWKMFWNQTTSPGSTNFWLSSADADSTISLLYIFSSTGNFGSSGHNSVYKVRPTFQIDLSKISWSK